MGRALETWSDATAQHWASSGTEKQTPLSSKFVTFRMKPVLDETFMPLGCVIPEGGGNAELRAWKAVGQWINTIRRASTVSKLPEHALYATKKIVMFTQSSDSFSTQVMNDLRQDECRSLVDECTLEVLSLLKQLRVDAQCHSLLERGRRWADRALQKGLQISRRATHQWVSQALKDGAGPAHRWCGKGDALAELPLVVRDNDGHFTADPQCVAEHDERMETEWCDGDTIGFNKEIHSVRGLREITSLEPVSGQESWILRATSVRKACLSLSLLKQQSGSTSTHSKTSLSSPKRFGLVG